MTTSPARIGTQIERLSQGVAVGIGYVMRRSHRLSSTNSPMIMVNAYW
jgi:hypothetical protein